MQEQIKHQKTMLDLKRQYANLQAMMTGKVPKAKARNQRRRNRRYAVTSAAYPPPLLQNPIPPPFLRPQHTPPSSTVTSGALALQQPEPELQAKQDATPELIAIVPPTPQPSEQISIASTIPNIDEQRTLVVQLHQLPMKCTSDTSSTVSLPTLDTLPSEEAESGADDDLLPTPDSSKNILPQTVGTIIIPHSTYYNRKRPSNKDLLINQQLIINIFHEHHNKMMDAFAGLVSSNNSMRAELISMRSMFAMHSSTPPLSPNTTKPQRPSSSQHNWLNPQCPPSLNIPQTLPPQFLEGEQALQGEHEVDQNTEENLQDG